MENNAVQKIVENRSIKYLLHFTRIENLPGILRHGIIPVGVADKFNINPIINDQLRLDGYKNSTSISIGFPNHRMLYKYRQENPNSDWVVIVIDPSILWNKECAFCKHNAADTRISKLGLQELLTPNALLSMFDIVGSEESRDRLKTYDPTDDQAEVLVFGIIEPCYIIGVIYTNNKAKTKHENLMLGKKCWVQDPNRGMFGSRSYSRS